MFDKCWCLVVWLLLAVGESCCIGGCCRKIFSSAQWKFLSVFVLLQQPMLWVHTSKSYFARNRGISDGFDGHTSTVQANSVCVWWIDQHTCDHPLLGLSKPTSNMNRYMKCRPLHHDAVSIMCHTPYRVRMIVCMAVHRFCRGAWDLYISAQGYCLLLDTAINHSSHIQSWCRTWSGSWSVNPFMIMHFLLYEMCMIVCINTG